MENVINHSAIDILLVEDNLAEAQLVQLAMQENKISCTLNLARDGQEALDYLRNKQAFQNPERPDLILLDLNLPKKSGIEVLSEIKSDELLRQIPVIVLSSSTNPKDVTACYRLYANSFISKPQTFDEYVELTSAVINYWQSIVILPSKSMMISKNILPSVAEDF